ncbi:phage replisome organizer N-terminal domain-containing protein [Enterococcus faecium]|uniref:phage replisome organizer N-terminal domain-containing protein n=1 Tax=Enterococcus faecium TaxID=1352 RepID=UPI000CF25115|nr:phage replisome organizer N-terminal domain-containing protein [Enterococcus faecium]EME3480305.1 phage replisome organizer N-terminal domain-containing protein [Enterococcus faecium]EME7189722.1 phage replisome organizer N-terminal domain-containing protein [Enterococcus faecium]MDQ8373914.1 phage replisome organizer N-terminal domain-containing protein [Enterococcus faecium]PQC89670.1 replication protein [Enterococcus faecium]
MAEISWIKLKTTMFDDEKIRLIQAVPESDAIIVIWIRLLVLAGKTNDDGLIYIQRNMPYTEEMLATLFGKNVNTVRLALTTLANFNMIDLGSDGLIAISNWEKHQNIEGMDKVRLKNAERNRKYRERKRQERLKLENDVSMTSRDGTDKDIEEDKDIDKEEKKGKYSKEHLRLAKKLQSNLTEDFPKEMNKVDIEKWADTIRLMEERDKASIEAIEYVINWLPTNEFWFGNIRSAKKLREKFEKLKFEIKADKKNHKKQSQKLQYSNPSEYDDLPI